MPYKDPEKKKEYNRKWRAENKEKVRETNRKSAAKNKEKRREYQKMWEEKNREKKREYSRKWYEENKDRKRETSRKWYEKNKEKVIEYDKKFKAKKYHTDPCYKIRNVVSRAVNQTLRKNHSSKNGSSILDNLPYTMEQLKEHLESQFMEGMSWENHTKDGWHIDHIIPQSSLPFDNFDHPNFLKCWDLDNLQPLWAKDNLRKSNNIP